MTLDLAQYRQGLREQERIADLMRIVPKGRATVLEIGARDGYISRLLTDSFEIVTALDLRKPQFDIPRVITTAGDVTQLDYSEGQFDVVMCTEVLEHIPSPSLEKACQEIARVARYEVVVGVPYRQDIRAGRTTCLACGGKNPPWGHVNSFGQGRLKRLFRGMAPVSTTLVGSSHARTNAVSGFLMDLAGNPWGTYDQEEPCTHCGQPLQRPPDRSLIQAACGRIAVTLNRMQDLVSSPRANWIHIVFQKHPSQQTAVYHLSR